jgi:hypothetical protein
MSSSGAAPQVTSSLVEENGLTTTLPLLGGDGATASVLELVVTSAVVMGDTLPAASMAAIPKV